LTGKGKRKRFQSTETTHKLGFSSLSLHGKKKLLAITGGKGGSKSAASVRFVNNLLSKKKKKGSFAKEN